MFIIIQRNFSLLISQNEKQQVKKHIDSGIYAVGNKGPSGRWEGALMVFSLSALILFSMFFLWMLVFIIKTIVLPPPPVCLLLDFTFSLVFNSESQFTLSLHILKEKPYAPSPTHPNGQRLEVTWLIASNSAILNNSNHLLKG